MHVGLNDDMMTSSKVVSMEHFETGGSMRLYVQCGLVLHDIYPLGWVTGGLDTLCPILELLSVVGRGFRCFCPF